MLIHDRHTKWPKLKDWLSGRHSTAQSVLWESIIRTRLKPLSHDTHARMHAGCIICSQLTCCNFSSLTMGTVSQSNVCFLNPLKIINLLKLFSFQVLPQLGTLLSCPTQQHYPLVSFGLHQQATSPTTRSSLRGEKQHHLSTRVESYQTSP